MQVVYKNLDSFSTNVWSVTAGSNVPSTLGRYASDCVDCRRAIHKCRSATHQWRSRLSQRQSVTDSIDIIKIPYATVQYHVQGL